MTDTFEFTLDNPLTEEQWDMITDVDFDRTDRITFHTKHGKEVEFAKVIRCKDCKHMVEHKGYGYLGESAYTCESNMDGWILPDSYCSMAEREEE